MLFYIMIQKSKKNSKNSKSKKNKKSKKSIKSIKSIKSTRQTYKKMRGGIDLSHIKISAKPALHIATNTEYRESSADSLLEQFDFYLRTECKNRTFY